MLYAFNDAKAAERHETQYFEMFGNRGIYHKGWTAVTTAPHALDRASYKRSLRRRRLGALRHQHRLDASRKDLAKAEAGETARAAAAVPDRGGQVQRPPARRSPLRALQPGARRPAAADHGQAQMLFGGMGRLSEGSVVLSTKNKSYSLTAEIEVPEAGAEGVIVAKGGRRRRLEPLRQGRQAQATATTSSASSSTSPRARSRSPPASTRSGWSSGTTAAAWRRAGRCRCIVDGKKDGEGRVERTVPMVFSRDETCDVGEDAGAPVSSDYGRTATRSRVKSTGCRSIWGRTTTTT